MTCFLIYGFLQNVLLITAASTSTLSPTALFWIFNFLHMFFVDILHCILLPMILTSPWKPTKQSSQFYVRKTEGDLEPRRCEEGRLTGANKSPAAHSTTIHVGPVNKGKYSYLSLGPRKLMVDPESDGIIGEARDGRYLYRRNNVQLATISD